MTYYNDNDPCIAAWLRELIAAGLISPGDVDDRSIGEVQASDLKGYTRCHFFAGIGGWDYALRLAGWPADAPVWTGSCPCQPFSCAGKRRGTDDPRHLWPVWCGLIEKCAPPVVFGEQVSSADGRAWLSGVRIDLEDLGYAVGCADLCAASIGAPHIRQRLWWVADAKVPERRRPSATDNGGRGAAEVGRPGAPGGLADAEGTGGWADARTVRSGSPERLRTAQGQNQRRAIEQDGRLIDSRATGGLADANQPGRQRTNSEEPYARADGWDDASRSGNDGGLVNAMCAGAAPAEQQGQLPSAQQASFWDAFDLIPCADGKARRVEPGVAPLAYGIQGRVGLLRGYGNAIVPQAAAEFIGAYQAAVAAMEDAT